MEDLPACGCGAGGDKIAAKEGCRKAAKGAVEPSPRSPSAATEVLVSVSSALDDNCGS